ncbi:hypothetical protein [Pseudoalteromonas spongiae]|uniref:hypothetical protein n=1 Tax=Pseudoalteromonas spongiae TaxID=298657 RepID=UPI00110BB22D|nr:hypothetical protein [Pseudoalteromonas spongiae]TMO82494.1 hypothetical protein CWC15_19365 [Pseudoalteromonas spongiae]
MYKEWEFDLNDHHVRVTNNWLTGVKLYVDGKLKGRNGFPVMGPVLILFFLISGDRIISHFQEKQKIAHIENIIATLPESERATFVKTYLETKNSELQQPTHNVKASEKINR